MNIRQRQMHKGNSLYFRSPVWLRMPIDDQLNEVRRLIAVILRNKNKH